MLMQAGFLALLVISRPTFAPPEKLTKELTLFLPHLPRVAPPPLTLPAPTTPRARSLVAPPPIVPAPPLPNALRAAPVTPDLSDLGRSLFGCAPEQWSSLTPEQRAKCPRPGEGLTAKTAPDLLHPPPATKDSAHWAAELASRKSIRVPCTRIESRALGTSAMEHILMTDPRCAIQELQELRKKLR